MYLQITSPCGKDLGATPVNDAISPCDGSYGLIEFLDDDLERASVVLFALIDGIRSQCANVGTTFVFEGFRGELIED